MGPAIICCETTEELQAEKRFRCVASSGLAPPDRGSRPLAAWPKYKKPAAPRSPPAYRLLLLPLLSLSGPCSGTASKRHSARPLIGFLPLTDPPFPPPCSYSTLPLLIDPTVGLAVDGDPMHSPLYQTWWPPRDVPRDPPCSFPPIFGIQVSSGQEPVQAMEGERESERWKERKLRIYRKQAVHMYTTLGCYDTLEDASRPFAELVKSLLALYVEASLSTHSPRNQYSDTIM
jgi:hypothetical protein